MIFKQIKNYILPLKIKGSKGLSKQSTLILYSGNSHKKITRQWAPSYDPQGHFKRNTVFTTKEPCVLQTHPPNSKLPCSKQCEEGQGWFSHSLVPS